MIWHRAAPRASTFPILSQNLNLQRDSEQEDQPVGNDDVSEGKDGTRWNRHPPPIGRVAAINLCGPVQKVIHADHISDETEMFKLYINEEVVSMITAFTNLEGAHSFLKWEPTTNQEINLGPNRNIDDNWSYEAGHEWHNNPLEQGIMNSNSSKCHVREKI